MLLGKTLRSAALALLTLAALALLGGAARAQTARYNWKCYTYVSATTDPLFKLLLDLAEQLGKETGGQLRMTCSLGGSIPIKSGTIAQAVGDNVLQFGMADSNAYSGFIPVSGILSLPGLFASDDELDKGFAAMRPYIDEALAKKNVKLLGHIHYPRQVFWSVDVVKSLKDVAGMKLRVTTAEQAEFAKRFGAVPVTIGSPEVSSALQSGLVQGALTASAGGGRLWREYFKSTYRLGTNYVSILLIANKSGFERLPAELRDKVAALVAKAGDDMTSSLHRDEDALTEQFAKSGMIVTEAAPEDLALIRERMRSYWPGWAQSKGPEAQAVLEKVVQALGKKPG